MDPEYLLDQAHLADNVALGHHLTCPCLGTRMVTMMAHDGNLNGATPQILAMTSKSFRL